MLAFCASPDTVLSRSGPIVPVAPAALRVWQLPQPFDAKTALPAVASPVAPLELPPVPPPGDDAGGHGRVQSDAARVVRRGACSDDDDHHHGDAREGTEQACDQDLQHGAGTIPGAPAIYRKQGMPPAASNAEVE
jgi:hypothetical protein